MPIQRTKIMYMECKAASLNGPARIGRVTLSRSGKSLYYGGKTFDRIPGGGFRRSNYVDVATGEEYWISGCKRNGTDRNYASSLPIEIDEDIRQEYWSVIRELPSEVSRTRA